MTTSEYNECVELYANSALRLVVKTMRHRTDAEDIVQNTFEVLWKNIAQVSFEKAKSYLFTVAYRQSIDYLRRNKRLTYVEEFSHESSTAPDHYANNELQEQLHFALNQLGEVQRTAILLRDYEGYAYHEIGEIMHLNESQVKVYIFRGRQKLQTLLKEEYATNK